MPLARLTTLIMVALISDCCGTAAALPPGVGNTPVWSDEFDGNELDLTKWFHRVPGPRADGILTPNAVSVGNGVATINTYTEQDADGVDQHYSGMIGNFLHPLFAVDGLNQAHGYFETRAKFHTTSGSAAAFWLQSVTLAQPIGNPGVAGVEMDIFEHRVRVGDPAEASLYPGLTTNTDVTDRINSALIWDGYGPEQQLTRQLTGPLAGLGNDSWHTYGLRWTPAGGIYRNYTFYVDGNTVWTGGGAPLSNANQYAILSSEVNANFAGAIPEGGYGARGDFDGSGVVDGGDFLVWQRTLGQTVGVGSGADVSGPVTGFNGERFADGVIGLEDLEVWKANFGRTASVSNVQFDYVRVYSTAAATAVPEPSGLALIALGLQSLAVRSLQARRH